MISKRYWLISLLLATLVLLTPAFLVAQENIDQLIEQLGDDDIEVRDKAQAELEKIGKPAVEALEKAAKDEDPERRARAQSILSTLRNVARRTVTEKDKFGNPVKETDYNALDEKLKVTEFGPDGKPVKETEYKNGKPVKMTEYYPNGKPRKVTEYKDGKPFKFTEFDKEGKPKPQELASASYKWGEIKVKTEKASGVQTGILESTLKGQVIARIDLPDTVYAGQPFTGSVQLPESEVVAKAEKMGWVEIQQKKYPIREGSFTVPTVAVTALGIGGLLAVIKNADGDEIGRMPVPVKKAPDLNSIPTKIPEIVQNGPAIFRDKNIDGIPNTSCNVGGKDLKIRAEVPGKTVVEIPEDLEPGQHSFRFMDGETDISGQMTKCDVDVKGPEKMGTNETRNFKMVLTGFKDWDFQNKPLEVLIKSEGSVKVGETGEIRKPISGVDRKGQCVVEFPGHSGFREGPFEITGSVELVSFATFFQEEPDLWDALKSLMETIFDNLPDFRGKDKIGTGKKIWDTVQRLIKAGKFTLADAIAKLEAFIRLMEVFAQKGPNTDEGDMRIPLWELMELMKKNGMIGDIPFEDKFKMRLEQALREWGQNQFGGEEGKKRQEALREQLEKYKQDLEKAKEKLPPK